ncbi:MAG: tetratricopeptide repeat protein [Acidobacteriota bacterium]
MPRILLVAVVLWWAHPAVAQPVARSSPAATAKADAYYEFVLARYLEERGDVAAALDALQRAQALDPTSADIVAELASFYSKHDKAEAALEAGERALVINPENLEAHLVLGQMLAAAVDSGGRSLGGRTRDQMRTQAIDHLLKILDTPTMATALDLQLTLARLLVQARRGDRAVPILESIISQVPFAAEPFTLLADARLVMGDVEKAVEALEAAGARNPRHYVSLGELYERQQQWEEAANAYERALANPRLASRDLQLRWAAALLNVPGRQAAARARDGLRDLLVTRPDDARGLFLLSSASLQLGDVEGAEAAALKLLALNPGSLEGLHAQSAALSARGAHRAVVDLLAPLEKDASRAKGREGYAAFLLSQLAHAHSELGEHEAAVRVLTAAIASDPLSANALNSLGYALADRGERLADAVAFIERALKIDPDNPAFLDSMGWALFKQGRHLDAEPYLRKAATALPSQSVIQDHFGDVLAGLKRYQDAVAAWERALAGDGEDIDRATIELKIKGARGRKP